MPQRFKTALLTFCAVLATTPCLATDYFVRYHHTTFAYGKEIERVMIHTGALCVSWLHEGRTYWTEIEDRFLTRTDEHFYGSHIIKGSSAKFADYCEQPVVQYWVDFKDGTSAISSVYKIRCDEQVLVDHQTPNAEAQYQKAYATLSSELSVKAPISQSTGCKLLAYTNVDPY